jgi:photosystem II stability/assembly factor-like uncharacterized protein
VTTERDFDALLRGWLDEAATPAQPQDLMASVRAATARSRPRPAWLVRLGGEPMPEARRRLSRFATIGLAAAMLVLVAIVSLVLVGRPWETIGPTPEASETPEPTLVATPIPTPAGEPTTFSDLQPFDDQIRLTSDSVGWVTSGASLFRTTNDAQTWIEVSAPKADALAVTSIVDADTAFVAYGGDPWTIAVTHDAGASWSEATLAGTPPSAISISLAMQSATTGSATVSAESSTVIYRTTDGGASWTGPHEPQLLDVGDFLFKPGSPDEHGILAYSNGKYDNRPFDDLFWISSDGGQTWAQRSFPTDEVTPAGQLKQLSGKWIDGDHWIISVDVEPGGPNDPALTSFYDSVDAGKSWTFVNQIPDFQGTFVMLTGTDWVGCDNGSGNRCYATQDAGATWRERVVPDMYPARLEQVSFSTVDHGWAFVSCRGFEGPQAGGPYCDGTVLSRLLETTDGGQTWTPIG